MNIDRFTHKLHFSHILLFVAAIAASFTLPTAAQNDFSGLLRQDTSTSHTISVNQLLTPDKALRSASRARQFLFRGQIDKAQKEITTALHQSPNYAVALDIQAVIHLHTGDLDAAAREFQAAINADPAIGQAYIGLGILLIARKQYKQALIPLDRAESLLPNIWIVYFETAIADLATGNLDASLKQIRYAESFAAPDPGRKSGTAFVRALVSIKLRDFKTATRFMLDAIKFDPHGRYAPSAQVKIDQMKPLLDAGQASLALNTASLAPNP